MDKTYTVEYFDIAKGGVGSICGKVSAVVNSADEVTEVAVEEEDGQVTFIPKADVLKVTEE